PWLPFPLVQTASAKTVVIKVTAFANHNPDYRWCQHIDGHWSTYSEIDGMMYADDDGGQPKKTWVTTFTTLAPPTNNWKDENGNTCPSAQVESPKPVLIEMHPNADKNLNGQPRIAEDGRIIISGYSGKGVYGYSDENICGGRPGYIYPFPVRVLWEGTVEIEEDEFLGLEIDPPHRTMYVGETQAFTVTDVWKQNGQIKKYPVTHDRLARSEER